MEGAASMASGWEPGQMDARPGTKTSSSCNQASRAGKPVTPAAAAAATAAWRDMIGSRQQKTRTRGSPLSTVLASSQRMPKKTPWQQRILGNLRALIPDVMWLLGIEGDELGSKERRLMA